MDDEEYVFVKIPNLKLKTLNQLPNSKVGMILKHKEDQQVKNVVKYFLNQEKLPSLPVKVVMIRIGPKRLDDVNLFASFKYVQDAIAEQLIPGLAPGRADGDPRIKWYIEQRLHPKRQYGIELHIEKIDSI